MHIENYIIIIPSDTCIVTKICHIILTNRGEMGKSEGVKRV